MLNDATLNKNTPVPLYYQLKELILSEIKSGEYPAGSSIPTEKELSEMFDISRTTVRQAVTELVQEGWLYRVKSKGTFVTKPKINQDFIQKLESYNDQIRRTGKTPKTEVLEFSVIPAPADVAEKLKIALDEEVIYLYRRRFADEDPIVILKTYLPYKKCAFAMNHDYENESLYSVLSQDDSVKVYGVRRVIEVDEANDVDVKKLGMKKGKPIQYIFSVGFNFYGEPIEFSKARYRGDRSSFEVTIFVDK